MKQWRKSMKEALKRTAIATSTVVCVVLLSFTWSEQRGLSLGVENAQGADRYAGAAPSSARVARRQYRRSLYGQGVFADAVASTTSPWNYDDYYCTGVASAGAPGAYYYSSYRGGFCVSRGYATGTYAQPTLFPRYYGWAW
jgi:hypothetical protein